MAQITPAGCTGPDCQFTTRTREHLLYHVKCGIPTKIKHSELDLLPTRQDFIDPKLRAMFAAQVAKGAPVIFMPNDIVEKNDRVDGRLKYRIYMTGVLPCGSRAMLILEGIEVHFDLCVPDGTSSREFDDLLRGMFIGKNIPFTGIKDVHAFKLMGFQKAPRVWKRITFDTLQDRKKCLDAIKALSKEYVDAGKPKLETAADDCKAGASDYYFPKIAREMRFATADWNRIEKYVSVPARNYSENCDYVLRVNIANLKKLDRQRRDVLKAPDHVLAGVMDRDNTMVAQWDIETWRSIQNGMVPTPKDEDYIIFMMCSAFFWHHSMEPMLSVCCVHTGGGLRKGMMISIECASEREVLVSHMTAVGKMAPEILAAFNGQNFDWPLYREKLRREGLLVELKKRLSALLVMNNETETNVLKWCFTSTKIKIDAETVHHAECVAKFAGMIDIDVLPIFLKMYPRMEVRKSFSLNFFLAKNGLESKEDMHFKIMFKIYERARKLHERAPKYRACHCAEYAECIRTGATWKVHCACADKIPEIDCKKNPAYTADGSVPEYTTEYHDDLVHVGRSGDEAKETMGIGTVLTERLPKCCCCGKAPRNADGMRDVGYYCTIDTIRPQQLCVKRAILPDKRELSTMSYVSLYDSFFRADGMKVRNLIGCYSHRNGIAFSNAGSGKTEEEKDHYPGAWVFPPERGLNATRPITGLDFASLYPSLMMAYNLSPDMIIRNKALAEALAAEGYAIYHIAPFAFERGKDKGAAGNQHLTAEGWTVRHNGVFNLRKDKKIVREYVKTILMTHKIPCEHKLFSVSIEEIIAASSAASSAGSGVSNDTTVDTRPKITEKKINETTREIYVEYAERDVARAEPILQYLRAAGVVPSRKVTYVPIEGRDPLQGERMGIFPFIVKKLFDKRVPIKGEFVRLSKLLEQMEVAKTKVWTYKDSRGVDCTITMAEVKFQIAKVDSKQKALKVLANTFYGESGNYLSSIYDLLVAAGITCAGQANIKKVAGMISAKGYGPRYGDSVTHDTPVLVQYPSGDIGYRTIDNLTCEGRPLVWEQYGEVHPDGTIKECARTDLKSWTDSGWTEINRVIRHRTDKDIYRIITESSWVEVTSDHSLLDANCRRVTPREVSVGMDLLHAKLPEGNFIVTGDPQLKFAEAYYNMHVNNVQGVSVGTKLKLVQPIGKTDNYVYDLETSNHHFAAGVGCMIVHNTDSIYTTCPEPVYAAADKKYETATAAITAKYHDVRNVPVPETDREREYKAERVKARLEYWNEMVDITMKVMNALKEEVSDFLLADNGTRFLNMAYEEVGFPTVLCGKKKYYMTPHIETINFYPKDIFIRGIDIIKQGQTQISKKLGDEFMRESLSPENERELIDIAVDKIRKFYAMKLDSTMFSLSAKYNPTKKNVPVLTFVNRMKAMQKKYGPGGVTPNPTLYALYEPPEPGDKFAYVIVKKEQNFTLQGKRIEIKKGDQMEFLRVYNESQSGPAPMEIDMNYYVKNAIVGIFARFIAYHPRFQPPEGKYDVADKEQYKQLDEHCVSAASKYLEELCDSITGFDKTELKKRGQDYRAVYRHADKAIRGEVSARYGASADLLLSIDVHDTAEDVRARSTRIVDQIKQRARADAIEMASESDPARYIKAAADVAGVGVFKLRSMYLGGRSLGLARTMMDGYKCAETSIIGELFKVIGPTSRIIYDYERRFIEIIDEMRAEGTTDPTADQIDRVNNLGEESEQNIDAVYRLSMRLTAVYTLQEKLTKLTNQIEKSRMQAINEPMAPTINPRELSREEAKSGVVLEEFNWG